MGKEVLRVVLLLQGQVVRLWLDLGDSDCRAYRQNQNETYLPKQTKLKQAC